MVLYGEEEEEMMQKSTDPVIKRIWDEKIVEEYAPTPKVRFHWILHTRLSHNDTG